MPCNLYGYGDNFHPENSHVIPGLIRKFHESEDVESNTGSVLGIRKPIARIFVRR